MVDARRLNERWDKKQNVTYQELAGLELDEMLAIANEYEVVARGRHPAKRVGEEPPKPREYNKSWRTLQKENQAKLTSL